MTLSLEEGIALRDVLARRGLSALAAVVGKWLERVAGGKEAWPPKVLRKLSEGEEGDTLADKIKEMLADLETQFAELEESGEADSEIRHGLDSLVQLLSGDPMPATIKNPVKNAIAGNAVGGDRRTGNPAADFVIERWSPSVARDAVRDFGQLFDLHWAQPGGGVVQTKKRDKNIEVCHSENASKEGDHGVTQGPLAEAFELIMSKSAEELVESRQLTSKQLRQLRDHLDVAAMNAAEEELRGDEPTADAANWYFNRFKEPPLNDQKRSDLASMAKQVRKRGLTITYTGLPCTLGTEFVKASARNTFRIREVGASSKKLCSQATIPADLEFS